MLPPMAMRVSSETPGLAGKFAVVRELCRWDVNCFLTLGNSEVMGRLNRDRPAAGTNSGQIKVDRRMIMSCEDLSK